MARKRYAVYKLTKVKGKKEYVVSASYICNSLKAAYHELDCWDEDLDEPVWYNPKTDEFVAFELRGDMLYVPNEIEVETDDVWYPRLIGAYGRFPIYYIDIYPNPYSYYKLHKVRGENRLELEGVK